MPGAGAEIGMPRPRKSLLFAQLDEIQRLYEDGWSTRKIAKLTGVSRWRVERALDRVGQKRRDRETSDALRSYATRHLPECSWPGCGTRLATPGLCAEHAAEFEENGDGCPWPRCSERKACYLHRKVAEGLVEAS